MKPLEHIITSIHGEAGQTRIEVGAKDIDLLANIQGVLANHMIPKGAVTIDEQKHALVVSGDYRESFIVNALAKSPPASERGRVWVSAEQMKAANAKDTDKWQSEIGERRAVQNNQHTLG